MPDFDVTRDPRPDAASPPVGPWPETPALAAVGDDRMAGTIEESTGAPFTSTRSPRIARPPSTLFALLQIAACSGFPTQILVMDGLALFGFTPVAHADDWSLAYIGSLLLIDSVLVVGLAIAFLRLHGESVRDVFLGARTIGGEIAYGLLLVPVAFLLVAGVGLIVQRYAPWLHQQENPFQSLIQSPYGVLLVGAMSVVVGGVREEVQRAFVLHRFTQIGVPVIGLIGFSLLFGLGHVIQGWDAAIITTLLGALWGVVYLRRRSLIGPAVCHGSFDVIQVIAFGYLS